MMKRIYNNNLNLLIISVLIFFTFFTFVIIASYDSNDPTTWPANQLKEWLAEHEVTYKGIPERHDLVELVKSTLNSSSNGNEPKSKTETIKSYVDEFINYVGENLNETEELYGDKLNEYSQKISDKIENLRRSTGITEDQMYQIFDEITRRLKSSKTKVNKNLTNVLDEIKNSYHLAKAKRDVLIQKTSNRIQQDIYHHGEISNDTVEWFKNEFNETTNNIANSRILVQLTLAVHGIQEELDKRKVTTREKLDEVSDKLSSSVKSTLVFTYEDYKKSLNSTLARVKHELTKTLGDTADYIVEEIRSQIGTVNDYRLLTQEKIQGALDNISQKYYDSKNLTLEQYQHIKNTFSQYFNNAFNFFSSATSKIRRGSKETTESMNDKFEGSVNYIKNYFDELIKDRKKYENEKVGQLLEAMVQQVASTEQMTKEQLAILSEVLKSEQNPFKNVKSMKDITQDKINSFITLLKTRLNEIGEKVTDTKDKVSEKIIDTRDKVEEKVVDTKDKVGEKISSIKDKVTNKVEEEEHTRDEL